MIVKIDSSIPNTSALKTPALKSQPSTKPTASVIPAVQKLAATRLPSDKLSASIIAFARFFSLPLKPQLLADIRRQALMPQTQANTTQQAASAHTSAENPSAPGDPAAVQKSFTDIKTRKALSLAAAAAESKGVELQQKGLESYTEAVDPDRRRHDGDGQRRRRDKDQNEQENAITADSLKKMALNNLEKDPLLDVLNKLPGKNGRRWIVIPFDFREGDREYFVSMRILTEEIHMETHRTLGSQHGGFNYNNVIFMALDVASELIEHGSEAKRERNLFVFESANEKITGISVYFQSKLSLKEQSKIKNELSQLLEIQSERIFIKTSEETFPFEAEFCGPSASVDEAV